MNLLSMVISLYEEIQEFKYSFRNLMEILRKQDSFGWIDSRQVMDALRISKRKLQSLRENGDLPFSTIRGKLYYKMSDLSDLLESHYVNKKKRPSGNG